MPKIAIAPDVARLVGKFAEQVENRSLLLDRYSFHKNWPVEEDEQGKPVKWDEASRWSYIRISDGASGLLNHEASDLERQAKGKNVGPGKAWHLRREAEIARKLASVKWERDAEIAALRTRHTRRFLDLFRSAYGDRCTVAVGKLEGRLAINLADSLIRNAGICLDRLFGLPYIPGSGVKGVCRHAALEALRNARDDDERACLFDRFRRTFGTADSDFTSRDAGLKRYDDLLKRDDSRDLKGAVSFLPAYPVSEARVIVDLSTVHTPGYYRTGKERDLSREKPQPNPFPAVEAGARFAFCLVQNGPGTDPKLLGYARQCLESALTIRGIGAKTASGYGWFSIDHDFEAQMAQAAREEAEARAQAAREAAQKAAEAEAEQARLAALSPEERAADHFAKLEDGAFAAQASRLADLDEVERLGYLLALKTARSQLWKSWKKNKKEKGRKRCEAIRSAAEELDFELP